jgi:hypothetical protein
MCIGAAEEWVRVYRLTVVPGRRCLEGDNGHGETSECAACGAAVLDPRIARKAI